MQIVAIDAFHKMQNFQKILWIVARRPVFIGINQKAQAGKMSKVFSNDHERKNVLWIDASCN